MQGVASSGILLLTIALLVPGALAAGAHLEEPFVFAPVLDDDWREIANATALRLPWHDPIIPGADAWVRSLDEHIEVQYTLGTRERHSLVLPVAERGHRVFGVDPADIPPLLMFPPARHHLGWSSSTKVAAVHAAAPPGTFDTLGRGPAGVIAVASRIGVPAEDVAATHEMVEERFTTESWRKRIEHRTPPDALRLFNRMDGEVVLRCDCTLVTYRGPGMGNSVNEVAGVYDAQGRVIVVRVTPWVELGLVHLGEPPVLEAIAVRYVNETFGHPTESLTAEFREYGLQPRDDRLVFSALVAVQAKIGFMSSTHYAVAVDPATGTALGTTGVSETSMLPGAPVLAFLAMAALIALSRRKGQPK